MSEMQFFTDGELYERQMGRWSRLAGAIFLDWLAVPNGLRWLDVGCGNGAFTETLIARCAPAAVHAVDPSQAQVAYAASRRRANNAQFGVGDSMALPYSNGSFDVAVMALVISFVSDPARAVSEMVRVVRPGGWVAAYMWDIPGGGLPLAPLRKAVVAAGLPAPATLPGAEWSRVSKLCALWEAAGLQDIESRRIEIEVDYKDFDDFWESSTALGSPSARQLKSLPKADLDRVHDWLRTSLAPDPNGRIRYPAYANAVKGRLAQ